MLRWFEHALHRSLPCGTSIPDFVLDLVNVSFLEEEGQSGKEGWVEEGKEEGKVGKALLVLMEGHQGSSSSCTSASSATSSSLSSSPSLSSSSSPSPSRVEKKSRKKREEEERKEEEASQKQQQQQQQQQKQKGPLDIVKAAALFRSSPSFLALREEIEGIHAQALSLEKKGDGHHQHQHHQQYQQRHQQHQHQQHQQQTTKERILAATHKGEIGWGYRFQVGRGGGREGGRIVFSSFCTFSLNHFSLCFPQFYTGGLQSQPQVLSR